MVEPVTRQTLIFLGIILCYGHGSSGKPLMQDDDWDDGNHKEGYSATLVCICILILILILILCQINGFFPFQRVFM